MDTVTMMNKALDQIEAKLQHVPQLTRDTNTALSKAQELELTARELGDRLLTLEQSRHAAPRESASAGPGASLGRELHEQLAKHREEFGRAGRIKVELKGDLMAGTVGGHAHLSPDARFGPSAWSLARRLGATGLGPMQTLHYTRRTHPTPPVPPEPEPIMTTGAEIQAGEGALKQRTDLSFEPVAQNQITVAGWTVATKQALDSTANLAAIVDGFLRAQVLERISSVLMGGSTEPTALFSGFSALAVPTTQYVTPLFSRVEESVAQAAMMMRAQSYDPRICVVNPQGWAAVAFRKSAEGVYIHGSPFSAPVDSISGMAVAFDAGVAEDEAILIDPAFVGWGYTSPLSVSVDHVDDQFIRNKYTVLAEASFIPWVQDTKAIRRVIKVDAT